MNRRALDRIAILTLAGALVGALIGAARMVYMHHGAAPLTIGALIGTACGILVGLFAAIDLGLLG